MARLGFTVPGKPVPQPRPRFTTIGKYGHAYTPASHPITAYRAAVRAAAIAAGAKPHTGLVWVFVIASFERPPSHSTKKGLKKNAPETPNCDGDNILKGVLDALNGVAYFDDKQADMKCVFKRFGKTAETRILIL